MPCLESLLFRFNIVIPHTKLITTRIKVFVDWMTEELKSRIN